MSAGAMDHAAIRPEPPKTYYDGLVGIPGYGDPPNRCRGHTPVGFCENGHPTLGRSSCETRYCPDHWRDGVEKAVINAVARLAAYREAREGAERPAAHVVASPPQDRRYSVDAFWSTRSESYRALEDTGAPGGMVVPHPYRTNDRGDELYAAARDKGDLEEGDGKWNFLRDVSEDSEDLRRYIEPAPHYHALVPTNYVDGEAAPEGWIVHRIRKVQSFHRHDTQAYRDMAAVAYYVLTHAAYQKGRQALTYYGSLAPGSFSPEEELTAAAWDRIQREAEKAVRERPSHGSGSGEADVEECHRDDCDAPVHDLEELRTFLENEEWVERIRRQRSGRQHWLRLRGMLAWSEGRTDRPPPTASMDRVRMLEWLEERGRVLTPEPSSGYQTGLPVDSDA